MSLPRLWSWDLSPFAGKARIALAVKKIDVELIEIDPLRRPARLSELNPARTVPVLEADGVAVFQSTAICEWAEEVGSGPALWPAEPQARARARGLARWVDDELTTNFFLSFRKQSFGLDEARDHPDLVENLRATLAKRWRPLERMLSATPGLWLMGEDEPSLCDFSGMALAVRLPQWGPKLGPNPETQPAACAWLTALSEHPAATEVSRRGGPVPD